MTFTIHTLGCKVNQYESTVMAEALEEAGLYRVEGGNAADDPDGADESRSARTADICIINSCAVTAESERKARQLIRRMINENPNTYVIVTGCYAQLRAEEILKIDGVSYVCGNFAKKEAVNAALLYASSGKRTVGANVPPLEKAKFEPSVIKHSERTRAYVKVEDGCDSKCAYCTIKDARGPVRSKSAADVHSEIAALSKSGYREVVLTGIEISAWGKDLYGGLSEKKPDLADLILSLEDIDGLDRVRLSSLDPSLLTPAFTDRLKDASKLCHHFHLSLQSGCDKTLAAMRRRYNTAMIKRNVEHIREIFHDAEFTADTIVGFPGESDEDFEQTKAFIAELGLIYNHIFPFSRRPNTPAYDMDGQIGESVKSKRLHELEEIRDKSRKKICTGMIGDCVSVLFERSHDGKLKGHTASFIEVSAKSDADLHGRTGLVKITDYDDATGLLVGELVSLDV